MCVLPGFLWAGAVVVGLFGGWLSCVCGMWDGSGGGLVGDGALDVGDRTEDGDEDGRPDGDVDDPSAEVARLPRGEGKH